MATSRRRSLAALIAVCRSRILSQIPRALHAIRPAALLCCAMSAGAPRLLALTFRRLSDRASVPDPTKATPGMPDLRVWFYIVRAESWATDWQYDEDDPNADEQIRQFESRADSRGATHAARYGEAVRGASGDMCSPGGPPCPTCHQRALVHRRLGTVEQVQVAQRDGQPLLKRRDVAAPLGRATIC